VDSPGLNDDKLLDVIVGNYLPNAIAMICMVDCTRGGLTDTVREINAIIK
jgi:hypothetical protein